MKSKPLNPVKTLSHTECSTSTALHGSTTAASSTPTATSEYATPRPGLTLLCCLIAPGSGFLRKEQDDSACGYFDPVIRIVCGSYWCYECRGWTRPGCARTPRWAPPGRRSGGPRW